MKSLLWEARSSKNIKLEDLEKMTGISKSMLNNIENEKTSPRLVDLEKIAKALGMRINDLYESDYK